MRYVLNRRRHDGIQRKDNDGRRRIAAHKDRSCPLQDALLAAGLLDGNDLR